MFDESLISLLLVEDDQRLASLTKEYLEKHKVVVTLAHDGERGARPAPGCSRSR